MVTKPDWLKKMENGVIGEARTYALLAEAFWVLERTVDINGADFIIQRQFFDKDINYGMDYPRLGFVQSKYVSADSRSIKINKDYVLDEDNRPRREFFLIIHTTYAKEAYASPEKVMYFLTAEEIHELIYNGGLSILKEKEKEVINITINKLKECEVYPKSEFYIVNEIKKTLENADYYARIYLNNYLTKEPKLDDIIKKYNDTIVAVNLLEVKRQTQELIKKTTPLILLLTDIAENSDPEELVSRGIENIERQIKEYVEIACNNENEIKKLVNLLNRLKQSLEFDEESSTKVLNLDEQESITNNDLNNYDEAVFLKKLKELTRTGDKNELLDRALQQKAQSDSPIDFEFWDSIIEILNKN